MPDLIKDFLLACWVLNARMAPYLLLGFLIAGALSVWLSPEWVKRNLGRGGIMPILKASLFGIPLPLCSCGVLPVASSLRRSGAGKGATAAFLISTPQTGVDSILVTGRMLGPLFAVFRILAALISGLVGGIMVNTDSSTDDNVTDPEENESCHHGCAESKAETDSNLEKSAATDDCSCESASAVDDLDTRHHGWLYKLQQAVRYGFVTLLDDIAGPLIIGIGLASIITLAVPEAWVEQWMGKGFFSLVVMLFFGMPLYICATGSVPIAAALVAKGASPGAALVFLMTGPATNAAGLAVLWKLLGRRATILYLIAVAGTSLLAGLILDISGFSPTILAAAAKHDNQLLWWEQFSGVILLILILGVAVRRFANPKK